MTSKIGYNIHDRMTYGRGYSAPEETALFNHLVKLKPSALLVLENLEWAKRARAMLPDCKVVLRLYDPESGNYHLPPPGAALGSPARFSAQAHFERYAARVAGTGIILDIMNEPSGYGASLKALNAWLPAVLDIYGKAGIPVCAPGFGEGHPGEQDAQLAQLEEVWKAFDRWHDLHFYACHEYGTHRGMLFHEGGSYDVYPWRVGRFETFVVPYLKHSGHKIPNVILTEFGIDSAHDGISKRGWRDQFSEREYFDQIQAALRKVYNAAHYVGLCIFSYGNTGQQFSESDWSSFDVSGAKELQDLLVQASETIPAPPPAPMPAPAPAPITPPALPAPEVSERDKRMATLYRNLATLLNELANELEKAA